MTSRMRRIGLAVAVLGLMAGAAGTASAATSIELAPRIEEYFYTLQLRGVGFTPAGEEVEAFVFDGTYDTEAFGRLTITDVNTSATLYDKTFGDYGTFDSPGTFAESFVLPYNVPLLIAMSGSEASKMSLILGGTTVASGGYDVDGINPSYTTTLTITSPAAVPEPASLATAALGLLIGLGYAWRRRPAA